jgi:hypothetical protein
MISLKQTNSAAIAVQRELFKIGLWNENTRLTKSEIYWTWLPIFMLPTAGGVFTHGVSTIYKIQGFKEGHIYIPSWILAQGFWQYRGSLRDIIRHEYGHALAHYYPELIINSTHFKNVFGSNYYDYSPMEMNPTSYIPKYAATMPSEDFAETFMVYVRRNGILPKSITDKKLIQKWSFIKTTCKNVK